MSAVFRLDCMSMALGIRLGCRSMDNGRLRNDIEGDIEGAFVRSLGIEIVEASSERIRGRMAVTPDHHQPYGIVHGGVYCTIVETLASAAGALWAIDQGLSGCVGVSNTTDFIRSTRDGVLIGQATPIHRGRTQQLWEVVVTRENDETIVAHGQVRLHNLAPETNTI